MAPPGPKCLIPNGDSQNSHNDAAQIIQKLHQLEVGQKKIIHLLNNLDKELSAREKRQCCFKHNNISLNNGTIKSTSRSFKTESFFIHAIPIPAKVEITPTIIMKDWVHSVVGFLSRTTSHLTIKFSLSTMTSSLLPFLST